MEEKFLINNLEKIIFFILIILVTILMVAYQSGIYLKGINIKKELFDDIFVKPPSTIIEGLDVYKSALEKLQIVNPFSYYDKFFERNSFAKYVKPTPPLPLFEFKSASRLYLDIVYKGFIESTAAVVGQIKIGKKTYFVKEKEKAAEYKIIKLRRDYATVEDTQGKRIKLPLREKVFSDEYEVTLYLPPKDKTLKVKVGDLIEDFEVLDIAPTFVVLLNKNTNERLVIDR